MSTHPLIDSNIKLTANGITSLYTSTAINSAKPTANGLQELMKKCPTLTTPLKHTGYIHHTTKPCHTTTRPHTYASLSRLRPEKYKIVKDELQHILQLGIIRPSSSSYSSSLHMVPKSDPGTWWSCEDFRNLNVKTVADWYPIPDLHDFAIGL